ncbi:TPA: peptidylprolyl isomerase [Legionella pneumophila]|uniref:Peptidyl-prolyl cis-trans isomerase n=4 Tax=Legionella pneumophila TaxID=446 RepID=Q5ZRZ4_LEGPH|nr:peptidylprolyl isomerase [Legionella pneumophila]AAU28783.1 peptidylprolyl cis-trans isomerase B (cyclophilin-type) Lcy [Legionella pneumophila subsp. pneumophila str. Philadelphia 1]ABQ54396.1 peptidylprolyl cis-trans isomerase B (cyclophilin-type) Lcy [Legionella pneumophila str. Corby]ADG26126.1 peptidyl-prolyl cis-trans isomerase B (cyclophilin B) [Legionella pneumophila 2300/99 Alcoy]AEW52958.1 peptidylprolyl cis-trans isomerase B (cyclophilin-type) Lcy [Legionella pneumophila subsp. pn
MVLISTSMGDIHIKLDTENTPLTAENFLNYVRKGFYNDTIFHRVIDGFMIQGGGLNTNMEQKTTASPIQNEAKGAKPNKRGTIAMARTMDPHSATAQFFINVADNGFLNYSGDHPQGYGYCVFGEVVEGMDVVDAIAKVKTGQRNGHADVPVEEISIIEVRELA